MQHDIHVLRHVVGYGGEEEERKGKRGRNLGFRIARRYLIWMGVGVWVWVFGSGFGSVGLIGSGWFERILVQRGGEFICIHGWLEAWNIGRSETN